MLTSDVENYPGFEDGIQGPDLMAAMRAQAERFGSRLIDVDIDRVDFSERPFRIWARGTEYRAQAVIIATGASALWLGLESETRLRGRGVSACATCDGFFFKDREIAVIGGGDTAFEEATYLTRFATKVHLLHRRDTFRASKIMVDRAAAHDKIQIHTNTAVEEVIGDSKVDGLRLTDTETGEERHLPVDGVFIAIGYRPNTEAFRDWLDVDEKGYLVVHDETGSKIEGVFIAGDVHDHRYRQAVTAAADGCKAAIDAERWLESEGITEAATAYGVVAFLGAALCPANPRVARLMLDFQPLRRRASTLPLDAHGRHILRPTWRLRALGEPVRLRDRLIPVVRCPTRSSPVDRSTHAGFAAYRRDGWPDAGEGPRPARATRNPPSASTKQSESRPADAVLLAVLDPGDDRLIDAGLRLEHRAGSTRARRGDA